MYRVLFRAACAAVNAPVSVHESCVLAAKCDKVSAPVFRFVNGGGGKALSTSAVQFCEKKDNDVASVQDEKTHAERDSGPTGNPAEVPKQQAETAVSQAVDVGASEQRVESKSEQGVEKQEQIKTEPVKSKKEGLLELLGAMQVEVTSKRKLRKLKPKLMYESAAKATSKPPMESTISMFQKAVGEASSQSETLDPSLVSAASAAASTLPNKNRAEFELLQQLRKREAMTEVQKKGDQQNLGVIISDMKVKRTPSRQTSSPAGQILFDDDGHGYMPARGITAELASVQRRRSFLSAKRLNIFSPITDADADAVAVESTDARPTLWDVDFAHQLSQATNQVPCNGLEEMIQWTKEGKLWQYPIDNEVGLEEEASVPFHEHIFLEKHLEEGFPRRGPVRHFMELVVAGLSKNPHLTVQQKKEHILWFRDYFQQKEEVLKEAEVYLN